MSQTHGMSGRRGARSETESKLEKQQWRGTGEGPVPRVANSFCFSRGQKSKNLIRKNRTVGAGWGPDRSELGARGRRGGVIVRPHVALIVDTSSSFPTSLQ